jgi:hypothetical protein
MLVGPFGHADRKFRGSDKPEILRIPLIVGNREFEIKISDKRRDNFLHLKDRDMPADTGA